MYYYTPKTVSNRGDWGLWPPGSLLPGMELKLWGFHKATQRDLVNGQRRLSYTTLRNEMLNRILKVNSCRIWLWFVTRYVKYL